jgi:hypothetical protein
MLVLPSTTTGASIGCRKNMPGTDNTLTERFGCLTDQRDGVITTSDKRLFRWPPPRDRRRTAMAVSLHNRWVCRRVTASDRLRPEAVSHRASPVHQCDSVLDCSSAPRPLDSQPPNFTTRRKKTDIPTLLSADILALRLQRPFVDQMLWNVDVHFAQQADLAQESASIFGHEPRRKRKRLSPKNRQF